METQAMCPHCGKLFPYSELTGSLIPAHPLPTVAVGQCWGTGQAARNPETDRRPLWKDAPTEGNQEPKKPRLFIPNPDASEPWAYCGDFSDIEELMRAFGHFVYCEVDNDFGGQDGDRFTVEVKRVEMTDAEVAAIPQM